MRSREGRNWIWNLRLIGTILSIILLVWLLTRQDWGSITGALRELSWWHILLSILLIAMRHVFNALRWLILLRAQKIQLPYLEAVKLVFSGLFASNFLPSMVGGDVIRIAGIVQKTTNRVAGAASIVVDRLIGAFGMLVAIPFSIPLLSSFWGSKILVIGSTADFGTRFSNTLRLAVSRLVRAIKLWANQPKRLLFAMLANWASMLVNFTAIWILTLGLGMNVNLGEVAGVSALTYYLTIIPLSINGYGIRELAIVGLYTQLGATAEQASALALLSRSIFMFVSLFGVFWVGRVIQEGKDVKLSEIDESIG